MGQTESAAEQPNRRPASRVLPDGSPANGVGTNASPDPSQPQQPQPSPAMASSEASDAAQVADTNRDQPSGVRPNLWNATSAATPAQQKHAALLQSLILRHSTSSLHKYIELPIIAVMGDTSSGKSSLLSSLTGLELPSAATLTTRCPVVIQLVRKPLTNASNGTAGVARNNRIPPVEYTEATVRILWQNASGSVHHPSFQPIYHSPARDRKRELEQVSSSAAPTTSDAPTSPSLKNATPGTPVTPTPSSSSHPPPAFAVVNLDGVENVEKLLPETIRQAQDVILQYRSPCRIAPDQIHVTVVQRSNSVQTSTTLTLVDLPGLVQFDADTTKSTPHRSIQYQHEQALSQNTNDTYLCAPSSEEKKTEHDAAIANRDSYNSTNDTEQTLQRQVQNVMKEYCKNPNCFVLAVLPAPVDIHNSTVLNWMRQPHIDPHGRRTIPVFTKPDLMDPGSEQTVIDLLVDNTRRSTTTSRSSNSSNNNDAASQELQRHPWFLVKNRGQAARDVSINVQDGWESEQAFFSDHSSPWRSVPSEQLGVANLRRYLVQTQWNRTMSLLPSLLRDLQQQRDDCQKRLDGLGTMLTTSLERRQCYQEMVQDFCHLLEGSLSGKGSTTATNVRLLRRNKRDLKARKAPIRNEKKIPLAATHVHRAIQDFRASIRSSTLATIKTLTEGTHVLVRSTINPSVDVRGEIVHIHHARSTTHGSGENDSVTRYGDDTDDDDESFACVDYLDARDHTTDVLFDGIGYSNPPPPPPSYLGNNTHTDDNNIDSGADGHNGHEPYQVDDVWTDGIKVYIGRSYNRFDSLRKIPLTRIRTDPSWLMDRLQVTDDLACFVNVDQFRQIVAEFVQSDWTTPCTDLMDQLEQTLLRTVEQCWERTLERCEHGLSGKYPHLRETMVRGCQEVTRKLLENARNEVDDHLETEQYHPYTQDDALIREIGKQRYSNLRNDLEWYLKLQDKTGGVVYNREAIQTILDRVFRKHEMGYIASLSTSPSASSASATADEGDETYGAVSCLYMAEEMELILSSYGKMATRRVMDRMPMICWQVCRNLRRHLQDMLLGQATDEMLEKEYFADSPDVLRKFDEASEQIGEVTEAIRLVSQILHGDGQRRTV